MGKLDEGTKENSCQQTREERHQNSDLNVEKTPESLSVACVTAEQEGEFDVPLVVVSVQETRKKHCDNHVPETEGQKKGRRCLSETLHATIRANTAEHLCRPIDTDDSQHKTNYENIDTSNIDTDRGDVKPTECQSEKTKDDSMKIGQEAVAISDDECISIASSSNTESYEEADFQDMEVHEGETQEAVIKTDVNKSSALVDVRSQFPSEAKLNKDNKTQEKTTQEHVLSLDTCTALVNQLSDNSGHVETSNLLFHLEDSQIGEILSVTTESSRSAITIPGTQLSLSNSELQRLSNDLNNKVLSKSKVAIVGESQISNTTNTKSDRSNGHSLKPVNGKKRISVASGIVYEDEVSSPDISQCSSMAQTMLSFGHSETEKGAPAPFSGQAKNDPDRSATFCRPIKSMETSKLPPGSTLVGNRGMFRIQDQEKPFGCGYCGKAYKRTRAVYTHIKLQHDEKLHSCKFCGKSYAQQYELVQHVRIHSQEKPFACDQCGRQFQFQNSLRRHKFTHSEKHFSCKICNKLFKSNDQLVKHSKFHNKEERTKGIVWNICKIDFTKPSPLKQHMMIPSGEQSLKNTLCENQFQLKTPLQDHLLSQRKTMKPDQSEVQESLKLPDHGDLLQTYSHPFQLGDGEILGKPDLSVASSKLATTNPPLSCTNSTLLRSDNFCNEDLSDCEVLIVGESQISNQFQLKTPLQDHMLSQRKSMKPVQTEVQESLKLPDHADLVQTYSHPYQLGHGEILGKPDLSTTPSKLAPTIPLLPCTSSTLVMSDNFCSEDVSDCEVSIVGESKISNQFQLKTPLQDHMLSQRKSMKPVQTEVQESLKLPDHADLVQTYSHPYQLGHGEILGKPDLSTTPSKLAPTIPLLPCTSSTLVMSDNFCSEDVSDCEVSIVGESKISNQFQLKTPLQDHLLSQRKSMKLDQTIGQESLKLVDNAGLVETYSHPFELQDCVEKSDLLMAPSKRATINHPLRCMNSTPLRSDNFCNEDVSGCEVEIVGESQNLNTTKTKPNLNESTARIIEQPDEEQRFSCQFCCKRFLEQYHLSRHLIHTREEPFSCDQCGMGFRHESDLSYHKLTHAEERPFPCNICNMSFKTRYEVFRHKKVHNEEEYREDRNTFQMLQVICSICKKVVGLPSLLQHMMAHSGEKSFKNSLSERQVYLKTMLQNRLLPLRKIVQLHRTEGQESLKLVHNASLVKSYSHTFQVGDGEVLGKLELSTAPSRLATTNPALCCGNSALVGSDNFCNEDVSDCEVLIVGESQISNQFKPKTSFQDHLLSQRKTMQPDQTIGQESLKLVDNAGIVETYSHPFELQDCVVLGKPELSMAPSKLATTNPSLRCTNSALVRSDNFCNEDISGCEVALMGESQNLNTTKTKSNLNERTASIIQQVAEKQCFSCQFCCKRFWDQYHLSRHLKSHTREEPFPCDQCGMRFILKSDLCHHKLTHTEERPFPFNICNKSFKTRYEVFSHSKVHKEEECREGLNTLEMLEMSCNICKKVFRLPSLLKQHMTIHSGEKPFKNTLSEKQLYLNTLLHNRLLPPRKIMKFDRTEHQESLKLVSNASLVESYSHTYQVGDGEVLGNLDLSIAPSRLATTNPALCCGNSALVGSDNFCNEDVSDCEVLIVGESQISNTTKTMSNQSKGYSLKSINGKRISVASDILCEDAVSSPDSSQCSTMAQTLLSSDHSEAAKESPATSSRQANYDHSTSTFCSRNKATVTSKLPPGSTLVSDRGVFRIKDEAKPFACGYCGKAYKRKHSVFGHIRYNHDEKRYSCEFCGKRYAQESDLSKHMTIHTQEKAFTCDQCGRRFRLPGSFHRHRLTHTEERPFSCKICKKSFKSKDHLANHSKFHNREEQRKDLVCNICTIVFIKPFMLKEHMMIHTGEKPFKCSLCDKHFRLKIQLRNHMNTHSGKNRLPNKPCSVCGKTVWASYMPTHMRMHTGEKPFECNICGKKFPKKINLEGHLRSHTGEKPFACSRCDKRFALYSNMVTHKAKCKTLSENVT